MFPWEPMSSISLVVNCQIHNVMSEQTKKILKVVISVLIFALSTIAAAFGLQSCQVTRTITNKSEFYQRGDTSVMIQTKTIETYDASKKGVL